MLFCQIPRNVEFFQQIFKKILNYQISGRSTQWEPSYSMQMDGQMEGQTNRTELTVTFWNIANAANNLTYAYFGGEIVTIPEQLQHAASLIKNTPEE